MDFSSSFAVRMGAVAALALAGCVQVGTGGDSTNGMPPGGDGGGDGGDASAPAAQGASCVRAGTGVILCERISVCPALAVDPGAFPNCGFRLGEGAALDLECVCSASLCPVGVAASCAEAQALLANGNVLLVCEQASEGRCVPVGGREAAAPASGCDRTCASECAGNLDCIHQLCGC